jgi:hypothetical protein
MGLIDAFVAIWDSQDTVYLYQTVGILQPEKNDFMMNITPSKEGLKRRIEKSPLQG